MTTQEKIIHHSQYKSTDGDRCFQKYRNNPNRSITQFIADMSVTAILSKATAKPLHYDAQGGYITANVSLSKSNYQ